MRATRESIFYNAQHGPLPLLFFALTMLTGVVDAVSILRLGRVFVANMTGNVVFAGFALVGTPGFALGASLAALAGFLVGASIGGWIIKHYTNHRGHLFTAGCASELFLLTIGLVIAATVKNPSVGAAQYSLAILLALSMGIQNAIVRQLAVPDLTTTVLTMTLTGIAADIQHGIWHSIALRRRLLAVIMMFVGAIVGAELILHEGIAIALSLATGIILLVTIGAAIASSHPAAWHTFQK
jgi:uncharacterized membrane protein YoaK (UPF0700 family)